MKFQEKYWADTALVFAISEIIFEKPEKSQATSIDVKLLERVLKIAKEFGWDKVVIRVQDDLPIFLSESKDSSFGIIIAPRG